ncbi:kinetochore CENP-C fungal-like protein [Phyllosticta capitalensis]
MAPANPPGRKHRENEFFRIGEQGRRTGVTLAERQRDEHGFEDLDGVFSSPEKSPPKRDNATAADKTLTSEDMDLQQSSMPEPADALSARKSIRFPPPLGRSPIKTSLGSSPRRQSSMGPPSMRRATKSPDRASSHPAVARKLDFSSIDDFSDRDGSSASRNKGSARRSIYDIERSPDPEQEPTQEDTVADDEELPGEDEIPANGFEDESLVPVEGGDSLPAIEDEVDDATEEPSEIPAAKPRRGAGRPRQSIEKAAKPTKDQEEPAEQPAKRAPGRPKKSKALASVQASNASSALGPRAARRGRLATNGDVSAVSVSENEPDVEEPSLPEVEETASEVTEPQAKKRGRPKGTGSKTARPIAQDADESSVQEVEETGAEAVQVTQSKKRGRPKGSGQKATANAAEPEPSVADEEERPSKRSKKDAAPAAKPATKKNSAQGKAKGKATARASSVNPPTAVQRQASMPPPPPPRDAKSSHILRATTPFDDSDVKTTRSGRASVKPLAYYLGEKIEYSHDRQNLGIIRAEDNELPKRSRRGPSKGKKRKGAASAASEEPELPLEPWEKGAGIIAGYLNEWDDKKGISLEESAQQQDIAYAANKIQTRDVADTEFRYAKIMGTPFMAAGMVDIPPNGIKRKKNSRRMHIVFCVLEGKVTATVGDTQFGINRGGVFVVPRGELSSFLSCPFTPVFSTLLSSTHFPFSLRNSLHANSAPRNGAAGDESSIASRCARPRIVRRAVVLCSFLVGGSQGVQRRNAARYGSHPG